jgi:uncharacterized membrane protein
MCIGGRLDRQQRYLFILLLMVFSEALFFAYYGLSRHNNYLSSINDLGHFDQAIWGFLEGKPFLNTDVFSEATSRLGIHFDPILIVFVPFYWFAPSVNWLIIAQSLALPLACLPIYALALKVSRSELTALLWASIYLLSPFMWSAASWDFHPVSLATPLISLAYLSVEEKNYLKLFLSCLFVLLCKEHFGLLVVGFGLLWYIKHRESKRSFFLLLLGGGGFLLVMKALIPAFSRTGQHLMLSKASGQLSRYGWLGDSLGDIAINFISHPIDITRHVLFSMHGWKYLLFLLLPLLFLPLLGFEFLIPGLGDLLVNLLSSNPMPRSIFAYHSVTLVPVFIVSAIYGSQRLFLLSENLTIKKQLVILLLLTAFLGWRFFPFFPVPGSTVLWAPKRVVGFYDESYQRVMALIDPEMSISVQSNIGAHFTQRHEVYTYPQRVGYVDAVILRLDSPTLRTNDNNQYIIASLGHHLSMAPIEYLESIRNILKQNTYEKRYWLDPWLVLIKGEKRDISNDEILEKLSNLAIKWK